MTNKAGDMKHQHDDLEAIRIICEALQPFDHQDRDRIVKWAIERLGGQPLTGHTGMTEAAGVPAAPTVPHSQPELASLSPRPVTQPIDIKSFVALKGPRNDVQFATTVVYYYRFEAPEDQRLAEITSKVFLDAARKAARQRPSAPTVPLNNAVTLGYLDRGSKRGTYKLNSVGENLVAMALPDNGGASTTKPKKKSPAKRKASKKKAPAKRKAAKPAAKGSKAKKSRRK